MFHISIIGTKNDLDFVSMSKTMTLHNIRDGAKKFKKQSHVSKKIKSKIELYLVYALLQFCNTNLLGYDIKHAKISKK